jgi:hypothetical protein
MQRNYDPLYDVCMCGDYRYQHENNDGICELCEAVCNIVSRAQPCSRFVLKRTSTKV